MNQFYLIGIDNTKSEVNILKSDEITKINPKQRWKNTIGKFKHALTVKEEDIIDLVRVRISGEDNDLYLLEISQAKRFQDEKEYQMLHMTAGQLKEHQLFYDKTKEVLLDNSSNSATIIGKESKNTKDLQAFVLGKDKSLYIATHIGKYNETCPSLTHASFLGGRPAEMAGMISINNGKIILITNDSGHYIPDQLDMYRGI